jgi:arylsulfatase A-like enzyme
MRVFHLLVLAAMVVVLVAQAAHADDGAKRPNILFCFADDWGRYASAYAKADGAGTPNDLIKTPVFDRIAKEGVLFTRAFVNAPSCTPCRSSLLSGQYFWRCGRGAILQGAVWDAQIPSFPLLLHQAGYQVGKMYKVWSPGTPADAPYGGQKFAYQQAGGRFNNFSENVTQMVAKGRPLDEAKEELYAEVVKNFEAFLAERKAGQPFCFWFGPTNVHRKWVKGSGKALWGLEAEELKGKLPPFLPDVPEVREDFADDLGEAQAFDAGVGRLLKKLEETGDLANTLVVMSGDHGPPGFPYGKCNLYDFGTRVSLAIRGPGVTGGRVVTDFVSLPDLAPTFLEVGGVPRPEMMTAKSLVPVLKSDKEGQVDPERSFVLMGRERHVEHARERLLPYPQRAIRSKDYLYVINFEPERWPMGDPYNLDRAELPAAEALTEDTMVTFKDMDAGPTKAWLVRQRDNPKWKRHYDLAFAKRPGEELYVLADDPYEIRNVAGQEKYEMVRKLLRGKLLTDLTQSGDPRVTGDRQYFEQPPLAGPLPPDAKQRKTK